MTNSTPSLPPSAEEVAHAIGSFLEKHQMEVIRNAFLDRVLQRLFNGRVTTVRSSALQLRLFFGFWNFDIRVRRTAADKWLPLPVVLPEVEALENASLVTVTTFLDSHWSTLISRLNAR